MRNAGLDESQAGIKIARRNINNFRYVDDSTLMAESREELTQILLIFMFIELVMPSNYLILCLDLFLLPSVFPSIRRLIGADQAANRC